MVKATLSQIYTVVINSVCFFASISQIAILTEEYFEYNYVYENEPVSHGRMDVPDLSLCLSLNVRYDTNVTARELFQNATPFSKVIHILSALRPSPKKNEQVFIGKGEESFLSDIYIYRSYICYVISWSKHFKAKGAFSQSRVEYKEEILWITVFKKPDQRLMIYLASPENRLSIVSESVHYFDSDVLSIDIRYKETQITRLLSPYATKCHNYIEEGIHSQEMCLNSCQLRLYTTKLEYVYYRVPVSIKSTFKGRVNSSYRRLHSEINSLCRSKCRIQACFEETFDSSETHYNSIYNNTKVSARLYLPNSYTDIRYGVKTSLSALLVNVGSSLAWWTGVSVLGMLTLLKTIPLLFSKCKILPSQQVLGSNLGPRVIRIVPRAPRNKQN